MTQTARIIQDYGGKGNRDIVRRRGITLHHKEKMFQVTEITASEIVCNVGGIRITVPIASLSGNPDMWLEEPTDA